MAVTNIVRIPCKGSAGGTDFVLAHTKQSTTDSSELTIDATESISAYNTTIGREGLRKSRARSFRGTDEDLVSAVFSILTRCEYKAKIEDATHSVEAVASVKSEQSITITFRKRIEDITPDICSIILPHTEITAIELYDWTGHLAAQLSESGAEKQRLEREIRDRDADASRLHAQLDELIDAKRLHENELVEKFRQLLNAKKLKIRDQQRLLAGAKIDPSLGSKVKSSRDARGAQSHASKNTKGTKRKGADIKEESESSDGFESVGVGARKAHGADVDEGDVTTPRDSDAEGIDEEKIDIAAHSQTDQPSVPTNASGNQKPLPPRRELPFHNLNEPNIETKSATETLDDEETDEEEL